MPRTLRREVSSPTPGAVYSTPGYEAHRLAMVDEWCRDLALYDHELVRLYDEVERLRRCITTVADRLEHLGVSSTEVHIFKARFGLPRRTMREVMAWIDQAKQFEMAISAEFERRWAARQDDQKLHRRPRRRRPRNMASWHERNERFRMSSARHEPPHFSG